MLARLMRVAPFLILGPLTGPLAVGLLSSLKKGRLVMGGAYALGIIEVALGLPAILLRELSFLAHLQR
jgi:hypothetical protein